MCKLVLLLEERPLRLRVRAHRSAGHPPVRSHPRGGGCPDQAGADGRRQLDRIKARLVQNNHEILLHGNREGAISAFVNGWMRHSGQQVNVVDYSEHALSEGTGAEAISYVQINIGGLRIGGARLRP